MICEENFVFQDQATEVGNGNLYLVGKSDIATLEIYGTATSSTVVFEGVSNNGNIYPINGINISGVNMDLANYTESLDELWQVDLSGVYAFRARISVVEGGYVVVNGRMVNNNG